ncbi:hypothetical protein ACS8FD_10690 [Psychrobacter sp. 1U2]|uniref:hypothetical protein n=1 Tax=Psychrobacter sp. 1U2 TaxID=3453577 RepID=UPI003F461313
MKKYIGFTHKVFRFALYVSKHLKVDVINILKYQKNAPFSCERLFVKPSNINFMLDPSIDFGNNLQRSDTGTVRGGDWDLSIIPFTELDKYKVCYAHFSENKSWKDSNAYDLMLYLMEKEPGIDGCYNIDDIVIRYNKLDDIFLSTKDSRKLLSASEVNKKVFREEGGIYVHIGRNGNLIFGLGGCHRLSIAKILELEEVPVQLGVVHESAISNWGIELERAREPFSLKDYFVRLIN